MTNKAIKLKNVLEKLYIKYNKFELIKPDPLQFVYQYKRKKDMEIAGFLASSLAYGRVQQIEKSVTKLLAFMGQSPFEFVKNFSAKDRKKLKDFKHRFNTGDDISDLFVVLKKAINTKGSLEEFFLSGYNDSDQTILPALSRFCHDLLDMHEKRTHAPAQMGFRYLLSDPEKKSACKRLNLFLRWMIRNDAVDAGLWTSIPASKLVVPVDVHMGRLCKILGLYDSKTLNLKTAVEITNGFAKIQKDDPVKYDFCLSRIGIIEHCTGTVNDKCKECQLVGYCIKNEHSQN